jgi:hypothetical protein
MRLFILYDHQGNIISAMKVNIMVEGLEHPYGDVKEGEAVLEVEPTMELEPLHCHEICQHYIVNVQNKQLNLKST